MSEPTGEPIEAPDPRGPHGLRPLPARADWRSAFDVYVTGRSRGLTLEEKRQMASHGDRDSVLPGSDATEAGGATYGVGVPEKLDYYRNAGTWRNQLPGGGSDHGGPTGT